MALEHYTAQLQLIARYAQDGQFGCFVESRWEDGNVEVILYDRWFDESGIRTEELVRRIFDASDDGALVASAEFLADVRLWAERRNEQREAAVLQARDADDARRGRIAIASYKTADTEQILAIPW
ncbi:MAG TPA: hypothetical protein VG293_09090 [Solirubrobacteraceae bacterium]|nr:hypothetical protein [Solirubrobacteraceae bacterium]